MLKIKTGSMFGGPGSNVADHEVVIPVKFPIGVKDALIGSGMVLAGIAYIAYTTFMNGAKAFEKEELYTMREAGIISWDPEEVLDGNRWKWKLK